MVVEEYNTDGEFVRTLAEGIGHLQGVTVANDGRVLVLEPLDRRVYIIGESGDYLDKFKLQRNRHYYRSITFQRASEQFVAVGFRRGEPLQFEIYSKDGEFEYHVEIAIGGLISFEGGITMTTKGRIACVVNNKVLIF